MQMTGTRTLAAPPSTVYAALLDPEVLRACIPGCTALTGSPETGFTATVQQKVGPVKATFQGEVLVDDRQPPESLTLSGEGKGGPAGYAKGGARVRLAPAGTGTELSYDVDARVGGKLAQLGSRVVDAFAAKMADSFFTRFQEEVGGAMPEAGPAAAPPPETAPVEAAPVAQTVSERTRPAPAAPAPAPKKKSWFQRLFSSD